MFVKATIRSAKNGPTIDAFNTRPKVTKPHIREIYRQDRPHTKLPTADINDAST